MSNGSFDVVFVCTGNRFRSPLAAEAFRSATLGLPVQVESFGTIDVGPAEALPPALRAAHELGLDLAAHRARCLVGADLRDTELVVGFELRHVAAAVELGGSSLARTFLLPELLDLLDRAGPVGDGSPAARAAEAVAGAHATRTVGPRRLDEIDDPFSLPPDRQRAIAGEVFDATRRLAARLFANPR